MHDLDLLTLDELATSTGLDVASLAEWEAAHGFPEPSRQADGERRYDATNTELIAEVRRHQDQGVRLEIAIKLARDAHALATPSIFAVVRRRHAELPVQRFSKSTLIAMSWAIEDECLLAPDQSLIFGAFQTDAFYAPSAARWEELARRTRGTYAFAESWAQPSTSGPRLVNLGPTAPMTHEWSVVCYGPRLQACLSAFEVPGQDEVPDRERLFDCVWSLDQHVVRDAARVAANVAAAVDAPGASDVADELVEPTFDTPGAEAFASGTSLLIRAAAYLEGRR